MWLLLAFLSATLLGFYDVFKKQSLKDNAVLPVLFLNTFFSSLVFLPFILLSVYEPDYYQVIHRVILMDIRVFLDETPSYHYRGTYQCSSSGNGAYRSDVGIWRKVESLPMDWGDAGYCFFFHVKPFGKEGRN